MIVMAVVLVLIWVLYITEHAGAPFVIIGVVASVFAIWQAVGVWRDGGVRETDEGITNRGILGCQRWTWDEIEKFVSVRRRTYLVTHDRSASVLFGVADGRVVVWQGGETRGITELLNQRLAEHRNARDDTGRRCDEAGFT